MKRWYAMAAIGKDRPGIVADLAELIFEHGCNLEDSSMTILGGEFAVLLLFTGGGDELDSRLSAACKRLEWERRLTIFFRLLEGPPAPYGSGERRKVYELAGTRDRLVGIAGERFGYRRHAVGAQQLLGVVFRENHRGSVPL